MARAETTTLYARVPLDVMEEVRRRAAAEQRSIAVVVERMLRHAAQCEHKVIIDEY